MRDWVRRAIVEPTEAGQRPTIRPDVERSRRREDLDANVERTVSGAPRGVASAKNVPMISKRYLPARLQQLSIPDVAATSGCNLVAIDFETANASKASPCSIGIVWIDGGRVAQRAYRLIRPRVSHFDAANIRVHGLHPRDVAAEAEFPAIWRELAPHIEGATLIAHNASFDTGVLAATLNLYGLRPVSFVPLCTLRVARRVWPELPRHGLAYVAAHVGVTFRHHHALEDAEASAAIALRAMQEIGVSTCGELAAALASGRPLHKGLVPAPSRVAEAQQLRPVVRSMTGRETSLAGKTVVVTGVLRTLMRDTALEAIRTAGGRATAAVSGRTDYLVVGQDPGWAKLAKARELQAAGHSLELLDEGRCLTLLSARSTAA